MPGENGGVVERGGGDGLMGVVDDDGDWCGVVGMRMMVVLVMMTIIEILLLLLKILLHLTMIINYFVMKIWR